MDNAPRLEDWFYSAVKTSAMSDYTAPEAAPRRLSGKVYYVPTDTEPKRFSDGQSITVSSLVGRRGECVVTSNGSSYLLGQPLPAYEEAEPNARERLLTSLPEL